MMMIMKKKSNKTRVDELQHPEIRREMVRKSVEFSA
jgi:hypothetical protein